MLPGYDLHLRLEDESVLPLRDACHTHRFSERPREAQLLYDLGDRIYLGPLNLLSLQEYVPDAERLPRDLTRQV